MSASDVFDRPDRPEHYLTIDQVTKKREDIKIAEIKLADPHIEDKKQVRKQLKRAEEALDFQAPRPTTPEERQKIAKRCSELEAEIRIGLPSDEEMRKAPPGALRKAQAHDKANKHKILEWRRGKRLLDPESTDPELGSVELLRPRGSTMNMDNAQIPGKDFSFPSEAFKQGHDEIDWGAKFAEQEQVNEAQAALNEELQDKLAAFEKRPPARMGRRGMSDETRAKLSELGKERHRKKLADEAAGAAVATE